MAARVLVFAPTPRVFVALTAPQDSVAEPSYFVDHAGNFLVTHAGDFLVSGTGSALEPTLLTTHVGDVVVTHAADPIAV